MKKIQLTEGELKRMIVRVMEQMNTPSDENEPEIFADYYNTLLVSNVKRMEAIFDRTMDFRDDIKQDKNLNSQDKERLLKKYDSVLKELAMPIMLVSGIK